ncbi:MAG TPA: indolepyruvate oxidoreductase subunit beta family protein [Steroidobacteraceae bacterium]|nr:indolepyruvate oxidoreductase subunit beta family protein [Steroidobacteraceae bacterium]
MSTERDAAAGSPTQRPLSIAIAALGGQGGGVLADWIVAVAERCGWLVQSTSVPGVAQRTGTTVYYLEMCPKSTGPGKEPIFALMPVPGDVDVVIGSELMEAGRAVVRGFVTPDRTTLVASTHRVYGITEKSALGDGIAETNAVLAALRSEARRLVCFDMEAACAQTGSLISSVLFGALAASGALPFARDAYEQAIRAGAIAVTENLAGFAAGFELALKSAPVTGVIPPGPAPKSDVGRRLDTQVRMTFPAHLHGIVVEAIRRLMDYQDGAYAESYLRCLSEVLRWDAEAGGMARGFALTAAVARHLALWMSYEDTIRVADLKTRRSRFERFRNEVGAAPGQIVQVSEYMHPRFQELCDTLPAPIGRRLTSSRGAARLLAPLFRRGRHINTSKLAGFTALYLLAALRRWRRGTLRYQVEQMRIDDWLARIRMSAADYDLAVEIAQCQRLIKGYSDTHERGLSRFAAIMRFIDQAQDGPEIAARVRRLRSAALADEDGHELESALRELAA